ncbi:MAG TPA: acyclic terpene utilization AtuA family protein, partial [Afifellaceae bacterium]|nr:acyclic terpene utilization AtuA family protein [Afifellaceae bacterium]
AVTKEEWGNVMLARGEAGVPPVIGTAGTCGADATVDWMLEITRELAQKFGQNIKIATLYSEQPAERVKSALAAGRIQPLSPAPEISDAVVEDCSHIVALAGTEQIAAALRTGADIILAGRTTDTATISALPLMRGDHAGAAWHGAKVAECGALCSTIPPSGVVVVDFDDEGFEITPTADGARCVPHTVSAHMLYENSDPFLLYEPGGHLDVTGARYAAVDERTVRVTGSQWVPAERYTVKLEGAHIAGYQTVILAVLRDARYVEQARQWSDKLTRKLYADVEKRLGLSAADFDFELRLMGVDSALGTVESRASNPAEVGVLGIVTAQSAELAAEIGQLANPLLLHFPLTEEEEMPTFAFPFSPAQMERGPLYEFCLNHVMELDDPMDAFRLEVHEVGHGAA